MISTFNTKCEVCGHNLSVQKVVLTGVWLLLLTFCTVVMEVRPLEGACRVILNRESLRSTSIERLAAAPAMGNSMMIPLRRPVDKNLDRPGEATDGSNKKCPQPGYLDCMPTVSGEDRSMCTPDYLQWIKEHCPDVNVVY